MLIGDSFQHMAQDAGAAVSMACGTAGLQGAASPTGPFPTRGPGVPVPRRRRSRHRPRLRGPTCGLWGRRVEKASAVRRTGRAKGPAGPSAQRTASRCRDAAAARHTGLPSVLLTSSERVKPVSTRLPRLVARGYPAAVRVGHRPTTPVYASFAQLTSPLSEIGEYRDGGGRALGRMCAPDGAGIEEAFRRPENSAKFDHGL